MKVWELFENFKLSELNANFSELLTGLNLVKATYLTANKTVYVATTGSDTTGDGTSGKPYKTIAKGLSVIPKNLNGFDVILNVAGGIYTESVNIIGFHGGMLYVLFGGNSTLNNINVSSSQFVSFGASSLSTITISTTNVYPIQVARSSVFRSNNINFVLTTTSSYVGIYCAINSNIAIQNTATIINAGQAVSVQINSDVYILTLAGTGNGIGIVGTDGSIISYGTKTISATTEKSLSGGSIITNLITMP